jgi:polar amino acid transport system substrate-binding protein
MRNPRFLAVLAVVPLVLSLGACGKDKKTDTASNSTTATTLTKAPAGLVKGGTLTVCSDTPYEPFEFAGKDGKQTGYDIEILGDIAKDAGLAIDVKDLPFDGILASLAAGDCDVVGSAVTITAERAQQVDFSKPYFDADQSLLIHTTDKTKYAKLTDLTGQRIAVQSGTTGETYAKAHTPAGATIVSFEDAAGMFGAIASNDVAAVLQDFPVNAYRATKDKTVMVTETFPTGEQYGFPVKKGNAATLTFVDDGLALLRSSGRFDTVYKKYFGGS